MVFSDGVHRGPGPAVSGCRAGVSANCVVDRAGPSGSLEHCCLLFYAGPPASIGRRHERGLGLSCIHEGIQAEVGVCLPARKRRTVVAAQILRSYFALPGTMGISGVVHLDEPGQERVVRPSGGVALFRFSNRGLETSIEVARPTVDTTLVEPGFSPAWLLPISDIATRQRCRPKGRRYSGIFPRLS